MKNQYARGWISAALILCTFLVASGGQVFAFSPAIATAPQDRISAELSRELSQLEPGGKVSVIVYLSSQADPGSLLTPLKSVTAERRPAEVESALKTKADRDQAGLRGRLAQLQAAGQAEKVVPFWIINGISLTAPSEVIAELSSRPDVARIVPDQKYQILPFSRTELSSTLPAPNANITLLNAPALWALGFRGQGVVVANLDTGVDATHPDLASKYRGGKNSWFDPYGQHTTPVDLAGTATGHGTATMSLMVAGNASGSDIGVAPDAKWIAAKIFDDSGTATSTAIHLAFQWILNPNRSSTNPGAPQVVSSSWGSISPSCDLSFQPDIQALLAAGILPVFSAGNFGPNTASGTSPANFPETFSVGAISNSSSIASFSSRGPDSCGRTNPAIFPQVVAPGVNVPVAAPGGKYSAYSGTSFSAPEAAGVIALLLSAFPNLTPAAQAKAITSSAIDLGTKVGPDNDYGYGRIDALAAYKIIKSPSQATPTPTATPQPLPAGSASPRKFFFPVVGR